jgi:predicted RecA/RadA family phage recombinase
MKNARNQGKNLYLQAPYSVASGEPFMVGTIFVVAVTMAMAGEYVEAHRLGAFQLPKNPNQAWISGAKIYWDGANRRCDSTDSVGALIGAALGDSAGSNGAGNVLLSGAISEGSTTTVPPVGGGNFTTQRASNGSAIFA